MSAPSVSIPSASGSPSLSSKGYRLKRERRPLTNLVEERTIVQEGKSFATKPASRVNEYTHEPKELSKSQKHKAECRSETE